jgi:serine protease AprX
MVLVSLLSSTTRRVLASMLFVIVLLVAPVGASAAPHRARLSADLADHLAVGSQAIQVILDGTPAEIAALVSRYNLIVKKYLTSGAVVTVNAGQLDALQRDTTVDHLSGDIVIQSHGAVTPDVTAAAIGADHVWAGFDAVRPLSGHGVSVAVIDSGIDTRHNAFLKGRVIYTKDFTGGDGLDRFGHGTHVAGIIAGQRVLADTLEYRGIAAGAQIVNLRVLGNDGSGMASDVIEAIDWAIAHKNEYRIKVINLSLGAPVLQPYRDDPMCEAVERAVKAGITVVAAAGNFGRKADGTSVYGAITAPGNSPYALTVGAVDTHGTPQRSDDTLALYSSKGPTQYDLVLKPDLVAPGSNIVSAEAAEAYLAKTYPARHVAGTGTNAYMQLSGTSMATGVVSGAVALLQEDRPALSPADVKAALQLTSTFMRSEGLVGSGAGEINVLAAVALCASGSLAPTTVAGEVQTPSLFASLTTVNPAEVGVSAAGDSKVGGNSIVWGADRSIVWGSGGSIVWGSGDSIVWGSGGSIVWGSGGSIVWGSGGSIVWGSGGSIVWGSGTRDSIVWGADRSIVWGSGGSIVWGSGGSIVWGSGGSVVWGSDAGDSIVWGSDF